MSGYALTPPVRHIALIGNFPPRRCGIATFTADLRSALVQIAPDTSLTTVAMNDPGMRHLYPSEVGYEIAQDDPAAYLAAADHLNALNPDVVCVQHEFGIFGGDAGGYLLPMLEKLRTPIVTTLHTILTRPDRAQQRVMQALVAAHAGCHVHAAAPKAQVGLVEKLRSPSRMRFMVGDHVLYIDIGLHDLPHEPGQVEQGPSAHGVNTR